MTHLRFHNVGAEAPLVMPGLCRAQPSWMWSVFRPCLAAKQGA